MWPARQGPVVVDRGGRRRPAAVDRCPRCVRKVRVRIRTANGDLATATGVTRRKWLEPGRRV